MPLEAHMTAVARPIPLLPPVMTAVLLEVNIFEVKDVMLLGMYCHYTVMDEKKMILSVIKNVVE